MSALKLIRVILLCVVVSVVPVELCFAQSHSPSTAPTGKLGKKNASNTPEALLGERLFLETRFAQFFAVHSNGNVNRPLEKGDPVVAQVRNPRAGVAYPGPFAGKSINCRSCHFVDEFTTYIAGINRSYTDFLPRSPMPDRGDGQTVTIRNSRSLVDASIPRHIGTLLHGDGEFLNSTSLVESTLMGRNFGWLPNERSQALHHIARVIREDDGEDSLGKQYGGSYARVLSGDARNLPEEFRLPAKFQLKVKTATDTQILDEVARLISAYLDSLRLERNAQGIHTGSAYDLFLSKNGLPQTPTAGETDLEYSQRLLQAVEHLENPKFVQPYERWSRFHPHVFEFREPELAGLKIFLKKGATTSPQKSAAVHFSPLFLLAGFPMLGVLLSKRKERRTLWMVSILTTVVLCALAAAATNSTGQEQTPLTTEVALHTGNCVSCHAAPEFTDFRFHNTGAAQEEYDSLHGAGAFSQLLIPSYVERSHDPDRYLPATPIHPNASGVFSAIPDKKNPSLTDLGMWSIFANPDFPKIQSEMRSLLCGTQPCDPKSELPKTIALFRTPSLRDLGHSAPYLHTGQKTTLEDVLQFYVRTSNLARAGQLRNGDTELTNISLDKQDMTALAAFLRSLDEDYDN